MKEKGLSKRLRNNVTIVNGEAVFVQKRKIVNQEKSDENSADAKSRNFFGAKAETVSMERQKDEEHDRLERQRATNSIKRKQMISKDDLVFLLQDSIDKSIKTRVDSEIRLRCQDARRFIENSTRVIEGSGAIPARAGRQLKFSKEEIN